MLRTRLDALVQKMPAFAEIPREARENATWVKPELVAQVAFAAWTKDNLIRQSSFKSLREDKASGEVVREEQGSRRRAGFGARLRKSGLTQRRQDAKNREEQQSRRKT